MLAINMPLECGMIYEQHCAAEPYRATTSTWRVMFWGAKHLTATPCVQCRDLYSTIVIVMWVLHANGSDGQVVLFGLQALWLSSQQFVII